MFKFNCFPSLFPAKVLLRLPCQIVSAIYNFEEIILFCRFWEKYTKLLDRKPIFVKSMTSLVGFALGDILAQVIAGSTYNLPRTLRMTLFGILMDGPIGMRSCKIDMCDKIMRAEEVMAV